LGPGIQVPAANESATMDPLIHGFQENLRGGEPDTQDLLKSAVIRQHTSAYVSILQYTSAYPTRKTLGEREKHISIRQHTSAYVSIRQHTSAYVSIPTRHARLVEVCGASQGMRQHTLAYVSIRQHTSAYVSIPDTQDFFKNADIARHMPHLYV
jgi:hypothetical protein